MNENEYITTVVWGHSNVLKKWWRIWQSLQEAHTPIDYIPLSLTIKTGMD